MRRHSKKPAQDPCLITTYAYNDTVACGRPKHHDSLTREQRRSSHNFIWGDTDHCITPVQGDGTVYVPEKYTAYRASGRTSSA